jgi:ATP-dependent Clp protease ATP-binding subunit ClpA
MFERFTDSARRVVVLAQEEARGFNHEHIGTEHLLLGLLLETEGIASAALSMLGVRSETVRAAVEERIGRGEVAPKAHMPFTPRAKKVLELSLREALKLNHEYLGTEHILLGLVNEGEGVAAQILSTSVEGGLAKIETEVLGIMIEQGSMSKGDRYQREMRRRMMRGPSVPAISIGDDVVLKRLEAIEARLSVIEQLLREQRGDEAVS